MNSKSAPLIGILTAQKSTGVFTGNYRFYSEIQKKLISFNGISFIFTLKDIQESFILGHTFSPQDNRWVKREFPYPDLVYNRLPFRKLESLEEFQNFINDTKMKNIPFFNPCFIDKRNLFNLLLNHPILNTYVPQTLPIRKSEELLMFLSRHGSIYLKPANSSRGKGVYRLMLLPSDQLILEGIKKTTIYPTYKKFWEEWSENIVTKNYIAQEAIDSDLYEGHRYDFRILAHAADGDYRVTGVGVRQSQTQDITTHIPSGGRLLPYSLVQSYSHDQFFQTIIPEIGKALTEQFGFFGEFSVDAGISKAGQYYIYEVNSKPMSFDEPEIEEEKINSLCRLFLQLTAANQ